MKKKLAIVLVCVFSLAFMFGCGVTDDEFTVTFQSNGGSEVAAITKQKGESVTKPTNPTRTGYVFADWFYDSDFTQAVTWPIEIDNHYTLYAQWLTAYTLTFETNATGVTVNSITRGAGTSVGKPLNPTRTDPEGGTWTFVNWHTNESLTAPIVWPMIISQSQTLYGEWSYAAPLPPDICEIKGMIMNGPGYTMASESGIMTVSNGDPYTFTVSIKEGYCGVPTVSYMMAGDPQVVVTDMAAVSNLEEVFTFTIEEVLHHVVITEIAGITLDPNAAFAVMGIDNTANYRMTGAAVVMADTAYTFTVTPRFGYTGEPVVTYKFGAAGEEITASNGTPDANGTYTYTIPFASITDEIFISPVTGISDATIEAVYDADFFNPEKWMITEHAESLEATTGAPVWDTEEDALLFQNTNHGYFVGGNSEEIHLSFQAFFPVPEGNAAVTDNIFQFLFFVDRGTDTRANNSSSNILRMSNPMNQWCNVNFNITNSGNDWISQKFDSSGNGAASYLLNEWVQIDITIVKLADRKIYKVFANGEKIDVKLDGNPEANGTTKCPRNFNMVNGDVIEFLDPSDFIKASEQPSRLEPLYTKGDYIFLKTGSTATLLRPAVEVLG